MVLAGKVFAGAPSDTDDLVKNASRFPESFAPGAGFRRCASRLGVPDVRASWFEFDAPQYIGHPGWLLSEGIALLRLSKEQQVQSYRFAGRAPAAQSLRCALYDEGSAYQFAARASALIFFLVSAMLSPSASYCNRGMIFEVSYRVLGVCGMKRVCGSAEKTRYESPGPQRAWEFNAALGHVAGQFGFVLVANKPGQEDAMLQVRAASTQRSRRIVSRGRRRMALLSCKMQRAGIFAKACPGSWWVVGIIWKRPTPAAWSWR